MTIRLKNVCKKNSNLLNVVQLISILYYTVYNFCCACLIVTGYFLFDEQALIGFIKDIGNLVNKPYYWSENKFIAESIIYIYIYKIKIKPK